MACFGSTRMLPAQCPSRNGCRGLDPHRHSRAAEPGFESRHVYPELALDYRLGLMPVGGFPNPQAEAVTQALDAATARVNAVLQQDAGLGPVAALFAPLGEALAWICALDELLGKTGKATYWAQRRHDGGGLLIKGLRYARNQAIHGAAVAVAHHGGAVLGMMVLGAPDAALGAPPSYRWRPSAQLPVTDESQQEAKAVYDLRLSGRELVATLGAAIAFLKQEAGSA